LSSYYTKTQTDTAITNSFNKGITIKNDNDTNNAFVVNNTANSNLLTISGSGNLTSSGTIGCTGIYTTGTGGLQIKNGVTVNASISQAGDIVCTSCTVNGNAVVTSATQYNPFIVQEK
jgi:hypothetical protein